VTKECVEKRLNVSSRISSFVLPLGTTINMDGTALYQAVAALFVAQVFGMDLSVMDQVTIVLTATLASVGAAGVPGVGLITLSMILISVGIPTEGVALILGVDRFLDMFRTAVNVTGDGSCSVVMAAVEGEKPRYLPPGPEEEDTDAKGEGGEEAQAKESQPDEEASEPLAVEET
jgi:Na+/H+-dicarboxylate symporter